MGQPYEAFWRVSLREYDLIMCGLSDAKVDEVDARRVLNQELGNLVSYAFHNPKKMPDYTKNRAAPSKEVDDRAGVEALRAYFLTAGAKAAARETA